MAQFLHPIGEASLHGATRLDCDNRQSGTVAGIRPWYALPLFETQWQPHCLSRSHWLTIEGNAQGIKMGAKQAEKALRQSTLKWRLLDCENSVHLMWGASWNDGGDLLKNKYTRATSGVLNDQFALETAAKLKLSHVEREIHVRHKKPRSTLDEDALKILMSC